MEAHGVMFHHFHSDRHPRGQGSISGDDLVAMIEFLGPDRILPAGEWLERAERGTLRATDLCLTFDDTLRCQFAVAYPVLRERGITAFWFVYTSVMTGSVERLEVYRRFRDTRYDNIEAFYADFFRLVANSAQSDDVERGLRGVDVDAYLADFPFYTSADRRFRYVRDEILGRRKYCALMDELIESSGLTVQDLARDLWMDEPCLRKLRADGHVIGLHSHTHPLRLAELDVASQADEYRTNHAHLTKLLGERPRAMSHPRNSYNDATLCVLRELGIVLGFRSNMARPRASELEYPREDHANILRRMRR